MGYKQLLLFVLIVILSGTGILAGMNMYEKSVINANRDAVRQDLVLGTDMARNLYLRPVLLNGAGGDFRDVQNLLERLNMPVTSGYADCDGGYGNENGCYALSGTQKKDSFILTAKPATGGHDITAIVCKDTDEQWQVAIGEEPVHPCEAG